MDDDEDEVAEDSASEFEMPHGQSGDEAMSGSDGGEDQMVIEPPQAKRLPYIIMTRSELADRQRGCIKLAAEVLCVSLEEAFLLLREHHWDLSRLQDAWFNCEAKVRQHCGLADHSGSTSSPSVVPGSAAQMCPVCMTSQEGMLGLDCGHLFCEECWRGYLHCQVDDGKAAVQARCPYPKCARIVPVGFFERYCDEARRSKFHEWYLYSYVDDNPSVKWCTNPGGCKNAAELQGVSDEIRCSCTYVWCWLCGEESHRPADCKTVNQWIVKNSAESENISWIRANTKKCPKCHKPIEKNQGCNHMVCSKAGGCGFEFCWQCLGDWATHGTSTGGYYQCNIYEKQAKEGKHFAEEQSRKQAKHALDRYIFFYDRFMEHDRAMKLTVKQEAEFDTKVPDLHDRYSFDVAELQFLYDAVRQVRHCRRVLKWSYVYGYYLEDEDTGVEKNLFEHLQRNLEEKNDFLHEMLEKELDTFLRSDKDLLDINVVSAPATEDSLALLKEKLDTQFKEFRTRVTNFTNVTQKFLTQILTDLGSDGKLTQQPSDRDRSVGSQLWLSP